MQDFKYAHISDSHLGIWHAHPELRALALESFRTAVDAAIQEECAFVLISGDFYDTSMPPIDIVKFSAEQLHRLKEEGISVYAIAGSHDYSPTGKTMLGVMESAKLLKNVHLSPAIDEKTGAMIAGVEGLRGGLDRHTFENLCMQAAGSFSIFLLHCSLKEFAIPHMRDSSLPLESLPKGFDYYANGHVHERRIEYYNGAPVVFPGAVFPCDFTELERLNHGSFCIVDVRQNKAHPRHVEIKLADTLLIDIPAEGMLPAQLENRFMEAVSSKNMQGRILLIKSRGSLASGKQSDVNWKRISDAAVQKGAIAVKHSLHVTAHEAEIEDENAGKTIQEIESSLIKAALGENPQESEMKMIESFMQIMSAEKGDAETRSVFDERLKSEAMKVLKLEAGS